MAYLPRWRGDGAAGWFAGIRESVRGVLAAILVVVVLVVGFATPILLAIRRRTQRNTAFLAGAIGSAALAPGVAGRLAFQSASNAFHALWLDLELAGPRAPAFDLAIAIRVGDRTVLEGAYPVTFDEDEHDAHGLPSAYGTTALNTKVLAMPRSARIKTVLRVCRFDGGAAGTPGDVQATITPGAGVTFAKATLLVTSADEPSD